MRIGARIMLLISAINFFFLIRDGYFHGGKVVVENSNQAIIFQLLLLIFLAYMSFGTLKNRKDKR